MLRSVCLLTSLLLVFQTESARILAVFPTPVISHQKVHRSLIHELVHRDHEVVVISPLPEYPKGQSPENLIEIDVSNVTNEVWKERYIPNISGKNKYSNGGLKHALQVAAKIVEKQFEIPEVKSFIHNSENFDLLLLEAWIRPTLFWTYVYDAPVISVSSFGATFNDYINLGVPAHPLLYPTSFQHDLDNLNVWQQLVALYEYWKVDSMYNSREKEEDEIAKRIFGKVPPLSKQVERIEMLLLNIHPVWQITRPVPMNVVHLGGAHLQDRERKEEMTEELQQYLDSSTDGVIYVSLGTNTRPWSIPEYIEPKLIQAFSKLPYSVLWKWDDVISDLPHNVRVGKWFPQTELLKHPNVRLFISQCGQQSTDEAIAAAVPILALPLAADQFRNAQQLLRHKVGTTANLEMIRDEDFTNIIQQTIKNGSYRINMQNLRTLLSDVPASAPIRAADAIEYVLRHTGSHIESPSVNVSWYQYMEIELLLIVMTSIGVFFFVLYTILFFVFMRLVRRLRVRRFARDSFKCLL